MQGWVGGSCRGGAGWVMKGGWDGSCRGGVGHAEMGWVGYAGWGGVHHAGVVVVDHAGWERNREIKGKERHSDGPHEFQGCSSQKCSRGGVGWVMQGWGGSCRGGVGHAGVVGWSCRDGVGWVMQGWDGVHHAGVWWVDHAGVGGSCRGRLMGLMQRLGGVGYAGGGVGVHHEGVVGWIMQGWEK